MESFLHHLRYFIDDDDLNMKSYKEMFDAGIMRDHGRKYWSSLSVRELTDACIIGSGERNIANLIETEMTEADDGHGHGR